MDENSQLELEPEVITQREATTDANQSLSVEYGVQIYDDDSQKSIYDNEQIEKAIYADENSYELNTVEYLIEPYFAEVQEYPQNTGVSMESIADKLFMVVVFIQLIVIFYFVVMYVRKRRQKNENIHNKLRQVGA